MPALMEGAILSHEAQDGDKPMAFASRSLTSAEKNYSHIVKEDLDFSNSNKI